MKMERKLLSSGFLALGMIAATIVALAQTAHDMPLSPQGGATARFIHASPDSLAMDVLVDDTEVFTNASFGDITDYVQMSTGTHTITLQAHGDDTPLLTDSLVFTDSDYTLAASDSLAKLDLLKFVDDNGAPAPGMVRGRLVHLSPGAPNVDVAVKEGAVLFSNLGFKEASDYAEVAGGTYELQIKLAGTNFVLGTTSLTVRANRVYSVFALGTTTSLEFVQTVDRAHGFDVCLPLVIRGG